ncbi:MAG: NAD(P)/FAD-dependent oxidoreductase [Pseudomonadota bacterium]
MQTLEADYLVIGAGAVGMSFVDTLLDESDASVIMVDNHHQPGGHWNDAYPFVRLHQPSHFYGVSSTPLGSGNIDQAGSNAGYFELASGAEVQAYFEQVMRQRFLPSGRVQYFPMCEYDGDGRFHKMMSHERYQVTVAQRVVDSTYFKTSVPSRHKRSFTVADDVQCIAPNALPLMAGEFNHYCVIGAGKTAMDAGVWLMDHGSEPDAVSWVCPRRSWMINREVTQGSQLFFKECIGGFARQMQAIAEAKSLDDLFERLEACGFMLRLDPGRKPAMFHYATISKGEVAQLQRITRMIEHGRVSEIDKQGLLMQDGTRVAMPERTLYVDCTASAVDFTSTRSCPVFAPGLITIQGVRIPNPCLSAAITAYVEANYASDDERNRLCQPVLLPDNPQGWLHSTLGNMLNQATWSGEPALNEWIAHNRLDGFSQVIREADLSDPENAAILEMLSSSAMPAVANLQKLIAAESGPAEQ